MPCVIPFTQHMRAHQQTAMPANTAVGGPEASLQPQDTPSTWHDARRRRHQSVNSAAGRDVDQPPQRVNKRRSEKDWPESTVLSTPGRLHAPTHSQLLWQRFGVRPQTVRTIWKQRKTVFGRRKPAARSLPSWRRGSRVECGESNLTNPDGFQPHMLRAGRCTCILRTRIRVSNDYGTAAQRVNTVLLPRTDLVHASASMLPLTSLQHCVVLGISQVFQLCSANVNATFVSWLAASVTG